MMRHFISGARAAAVILALSGAALAAPSAPAAQAERHFAPQPNIWQLAPARHQAAEQPKTDAAKQQPKTGAAKEQPAPKRRKKPRREQIRLLNIKDKQHKLLLACGVNSGRLNIAAIFPRQEGKAAEKGKIAPLSVAIDGKPSLSKAEGKYGRARKDTVIVRLALRGDETARFISQFLAAKNSIAVSLGNGQSASYSAAQAGQAGLALQNCLHK